ncbi:hypothetical protein PAXINDRAFT_21738 [Paxillus involutus ATCC 200175]|uniref:CUB domain-containing protein n=1 Tax=Paxillus involutus ATCC 200175 TaxID=664439 RepID=A0A0C9T9S5_PAXIN|nr:hypothetical protein PAXINDRAFT_21738 [Paxillus involutus ATCC 200175]
MKTFLTLLVAITSLSAYTLVGVHAKTKCATCPETVNNGSDGLEDSCYQNSGAYRQNRYGSKTGPEGFRCYYNVRTRLHTAFQFDLTVEFSSLQTNGGMNKGSNGACPKTVGTGTGCSCT